MLNRENILRSRCGPASTYVCTDAWEGRFTLHALPDDPRVVSALSYDDPRGAGMWIPLPSAQAAAPIP